jgi:hypothetical protein
MSISSHLGMVLLVIVGIATILAVIIIAVVETRRVDSGEPTIPQPSAEKSPDKKKT